MASARRLLRHSSGTPVAGLGNGRNYMADNDKNHGKNRGPVTEGPSLHGDKTVSKLAENTNTPDPERGASGPRHDENEIRAHDTTGRDRLFEGREQHDEAE